METLSDNEAEVRETVLTLLRDWVDAAPEATERFLGRVAEDFTGYGTGPGDYYANLNALREMVVREHAGMSYPFTLDIPWMTAKVLSPDVALAVGELAVAIQMPTETVLETPRFTFILHRLDTRWILKHFHFSVPDAMQRVGDTMDDLLATRNRQLEAEVARRTAELEAAQARLIQQEKMASLGQLTAGIAHEIKNPLNFIINFASLSRELVDELADTPAPEDQPDLLTDLATNAAKIEEHASRADAIVRSMMDHARSGDGRRKPVAVNRLVVDTLDRAVHGRLARDPDADVRVTRDLASDAGSVLGVAEDLSRVLVNLLDNAFDAVDDRAAGAPASPGVHISTHRQGPTVVIRVEDAGDGIDDTVRTRAFEPFFTTKPPGKGTGLGLSLSYDIIAQGHGGDLALESTPGEGTAAIVTLPSADPNGDAAEGS